ncbi:phosphoinositide-interacting protein-like [Tachysurus ichikawai]
MSSAAEGPQSSMRIDGLVQNPFYAVQEPVAAEPTLWTYYNKPIILAAIGGLALCTGIVFYLLGEFRVTDMPQSVGPVCLSVGILFIVVALVLLPIIKDKIRRQGPKTRRTFHMEHV